MYKSSDYATEIFEGEFNDFTNSSLLFPQDEFDIISGVMDNYGLRARRNTSVFSRVIMYNIIRSPVTDRSTTSSIFTINKNSDDWYTVRCHIDNRYYKCDRLDGLTFQLEQCLLDIKDDLIKDKMKINIFDSLANMSIEDIKYINDYIENRK